MRPWALLALPFLHLLFVAMTIGGFVFGWVSLITGSTRYLTRNIRAADKSGAAFLGWSGDKTISNECGDDPECRFCKASAPVVDAILESDHYAKNRTT